MSREEKMRARVMVWELTVILEASEEGGRERKRGRLDLERGACGAEFRFLLRTREIERYHYY